MNLLWYLEYNAIDSGKSYIKMNGITGLEVSRHHLGDPGFQLWAMAGESGGWPTEYKLKRDAIADAKKISAAFNLPLVIK